MNKSKCEQIISELADKTLSFGCKIKGLMTADSPLYIYGERNGRYYATTEYSNKTSDYELIEDEFEIIGHPVGIARVLSKIDYLDSSDKERDAWNMVKLWQPLGFETTLNEMAGGEVEEVCECGYSWKGCRTGACCPEMGNIPSNGEPIVMHGKRQWFKDPNVNELFSLLDKIFNL